MHFPCYLLIKLSLISVVLGIINVENTIKNETQLEGTVNEINNRLDMAIILERLITYVDGKMVSLNKKADEQLAGSLNATMREAITKMTQIFEESNLDFEEKIIARLDAYEHKMAETLDSIKAEANKNAAAQFPCKEHLLNSDNRNSQSYSISSGFFNYIPVERKSTGHLKHFEAIIAVKADSDIVIRLMNKGSYSDSDVLYYILIGYSGNQYTNLDKFSGGYSTVQHVYTPDILSATNFRKFYVKIDNGTLEFGAEGGSPLISTVDTSLGVVNYLQIRYGWNNEANIRFDCPASAK